MVKIDNFLLPTIIFLLEKLYANLTTILKATLLQK